MLKITNENLDSILLKIVFVFEIIMAVLIAIGFVPREFADLLTVLMIVYIIGTNMENSLTLAILSIPFYLALPITSSFDSMASWRIIIAVLFLKFAFEKRMTLRSLNIKRIKDLFLDKNNRLLLWSAIFGAIGIISLAGSGNINAGIKKILFLANIFVLFIIVKSISRNKEIFLKIMKTSVLAGALSLAIGYMQILSIFRISLEHFWQFWDDNAISALYGTNLSNLLSYSNTWFSYYSGDDIPPTLRMFSVFPDSHSFALFNVILIPFILTLILHCKNNSRRLAAYCALLAASLLGIILSGSRGAWVSGIAPLGVTAVLAAPYLKKTIAAWKNGLRQSSKIKNFAQYLFSGRLRMIASATILFFVLFPVSSVVLEQTQKAEWKRLNTQGDFASFAMYKRLKSITDLDEISNKGRIEIWKDTLVSIKKHPLLGVGIGNFPTVLGKNITAAKKGASAHNLYLDIMAEMGVLGLIAFLIIIYEILKTVRNIFMNSKDELYRFFALGAGIYLFWNLGYALFDVVLFNDKVLMMFMVELGLLYGINNTVNDKPEKISG